MKKSNWKWWLLIAGSLWAVGRNSTTESTYSGQFAADMFFGGGILFLIGLTIDTIRLEFWKKPGNSPRSMLKWWLLGFGFWLSLGNWFSQPPIFFATFILFDFIRNMIWGFIIGFGIDLFLDFIQKGKRNKKIEQMPQKEKQEIPNISGEVIEINGKYYHVKKIKDGEPKSE